MQKSHQEDLLEKAEEAFLEGKYTHALRSYGFIFESNPSLDEAKVGIYLSDLGIENAEEAQALFDYYQLIKDEKSDAFDIINGLIENIDAAKEEIQKQILDPREEQLEYGEGIRYYDFLALVKSRGSFKRTFEDIMFSTKVIISSKDEFIDFVTQLCEEGFDEMALGYLDRSSHLFGNDQEVLGLYHLIQGVST
ncbi:MAG: hypothetical protein Q9M36_15415 [Sulfurovum sp.]|nr:hypothetical protein [Sulfurovum sp.]